MMFLRGVVAAAGVVIVAPNYAPRSTHARSVYGATYAVVFCEVVLWWGALRGAGAEDTGGKHLIDCAATHLECIGKGMA